MFVVQHTDDRSTPSDERAKSVFAKVLDSPIVGMAPWIVLSLLEGPGRFELAVAVPLAMSLSILVADPLRGRSIKLLACADVVFFAALLTVGLVISQDSKDWLERWCGEISNVSLVIIAVGSIAMRLPFTIQYAREQVPKESWSSPTFIKVNYVITGVWAGAFAVAALAGGYGDGVLHNSNNLWTGWIIQVAAILVALRFTEWYPEVAQARVRQSEGMPGELAPTTGQLLIPMAAWLVPAGILSLSLDGGPTWLGIGLIVVGALLTRALATGRSHGQPGLRAG